MGVRNLVVVCFDTVRFDAFDLSTRAAEDPLAPWEARALRMARAQSPAPWTVPAVGSLLTGLYPNVHGAGRFSSPIANLDVAPPAKIRPDALQLARLLGEHGFESNALVAHPWFVTGYGLAQGFDNVELDKSRGALAKRGEAWLMEPGRKRNRFFLYGHFMDAHRAVSWNPEERIRRARRVSPKLKSLAIEHAPKQICARHEDPRCLWWLAYVGSVADQRQTVASWLATLMRAGMLNDTVIVLYSDHGEEFDDHGAELRAVGADPRGVYGLGHGQSLYQELLHVPLHIWLPGEEGRVVDEPVSLVDVMPSVLDWLGVPRPEALEANASIDPGGSTDGPRSLFSSGIAYGPEQWAVRRGDWKLITRDGDSLLFDLATDAHEKSPVDAPDRETELGGRVADYRAGAGGVMDAPELSPEELERLRSLGYLGGAEGR